MTDIKAVRQLVVDTLSDAGLDAHHYRPGLVPPVVLVMPDDPYVQEADGYQYTLINLVIQIWASTSNLKTAPDELDDAIQTALSALGQAFINVNSVSVAEPGISTAGAGTYLATEISLSVWATI